MSMRILYYPTKDRSARTERQLVLSPGSRITIGRDSRHGIPLADGLVSRDHAQIEFDGSNVVIADLKSRNGTLLGGQRISRSTWAAGQRVAIGGYTFELEHGAGRTAATAPMPVLPPTAAATHMPLRTGSGATFLPLRERARVTIGFIWAYISMLLLILVFQFGHAIYLLEKKFAYPTWLFLGNLMFPHFSEALRLFIFVTLLVSAVSLLGTYIAFLSWQFRAARNLQSFPLTGTSFPPEVSLTWWLLPLAGLIVLIVTAISLPPQYVTIVLITFVIILGLSCVQILRSVSEYWRASIPGVTGNRWQAIATSPVVLAWWICWLVLPFLIGFVSGVVHATSHATPNPWVALQLKYPFGLAVFMFVLSLLSAIFGSLLLIKIINRITDNQTSTYKGYSPSATRMS